MSHLSPLDLLNPTNQTAQTDQSSQAQPKCKQIYAISEVNKYVKHLLDEDYSLTNIWISGEISNCKYYPSGHIYFTLKDPDAQIKAVMFNSYAAKLNVALRDGMNVLAKCQVGLYDKHGSYQANVFQIEEQGVGTLHEAFEKLKQTLYQEGLFEYKKTIPKYPSKIGIITSDKGAALQDILQIAARRNKSVPIYIYPAAVQGDSAKAQISEQIRRANRDLLVEFADVALHVV